MPCRSRDVSMITVVRMRLEGKTCVVTGAGGGIGRAVALALAEEGAAVVVNDAVRENAEKVVQEIADSGGTAVVNAERVGSMETADSLVDTAVEAFGRLDVLVNNAGVMRDRMTHNMTEEDFDFVIQVHLKGAWANGRAAIRLWRPLAKAEAEKGDITPRKIINVTSASGLMGSAAQSNYASAKMGVVGLTKTWARELGRLGIRCNAVAPVAFTPMTEHLFEDEEAAKARLARFPLGRYGEPEEVARTFLFLASSDADYITGQVICVDGGLAI